MQIATAVEHLHNEANIEGEEMLFLNLLQDIEEYGRKLYSERTMEAYAVLMRLE